MPYNSYWGIPWSYWDGAIPKDWGAYGEARVAHGFVEDWRLERNWRSYTVPCGAKLLIEPDFSIPYEPPIAAVLWQT